MAFSQLPAYNTGGTINFEPLGNAIDQYGQVKRQNALLDYQKSQDKIQNQRQNALLGIQQQQAQRAQAQFDEQRGKEALNQMAGIYQAIESAPEAERAGMYQRFKPVYDRLRQRIPEFDQDAAALGVDPNDHTSFGKLIIAQARGYQDPLEAQKAQADIALKNAQAGYYNERPRTAAGGASNELIKQLVDQGYSLEDAITLVKRGGGVQVVGDQLLNRNTGAPMRSVAPELAGGERAKVLGKASGEATTALPKVQMAIQAFNQKSDRLNNVIDRAISRIGPNTTGWAGLLSSIPGTEARALKTDLDTIRANVGFEELQAMRDASPTGGALGQVSEQENLLLQSIRGSLDQMNAGQNLAENLNIIKNSVAQLKALKAQQYEADVGRANGSAMPAAAPQSAPVVNPLKQKYGLE